MSDTPSPVNSPLRILSGPHRLSAAAATEIGVQASNLSERLASGVEPNTAFVVLVDLENLIMTPQGDEETSRRDRRRCLDAWAKGTTAIAEHLPRFLGFQGSAGDFLAKSEWYFFADPGTPRRFGLRGDSSGQARFDQTLEAVLQHGLFSGKGLPKNGFKILHANVQNDLAILLLAGRLLADRPDGKVVICSRDKFSDHRVLTDSLLLNALANDRSFYSHIVETTWSADDKWSVKALSAGHSRSKVGGPDSALLAPVPGEPDKMQCCTNLDCYSKKVVLPGSVNQRSETLGPAAGVEFGGMVHLWASAEHFAPETRSTFVKANWCPYCGAGSKVEDRAFPTLLISPELEIGDSYSSTALQEIVFPLLPGRALGLDGEQLGLSSGSNVTFTLNKFDLTGNWDNCITNAAFRAEVTKPLQIRGTGRFEGGVSKSRRTVEVEGHQSTGYPYAFSIKVAGVFPPDGRAARVRLLRNR